MLELPIPERIVFVSAVIVHLAAAILGILQLRPSCEKCRRFLSPLVFLAVGLEAGMLILRAFELRAIPLTGLFESLIVLTMVFGLTYVFFSITVRQVWFGSVMVWVILAMIILAGVAAEPASKPVEAAATPWAIAHGIMMILGGALTTFATASAFLYLLGKRKLKQKKVAQVLGKVPNIEKLERMNLLGVKLGLLALTLGLISGFGLVVIKSRMLDVSIIDWLTDAKIVLIAAVWILLTTILVLRRVAKLRAAATAYMTMTAFFLILFAIAGTTVFCESKHDFARTEDTRVEQRE